MKDAWKRTTVYQIYPKSFFDSNGDGYGDIKGIMKKLDYLEELGIGAIWLTPMYYSPQVDNGYDISDYNEIDPMFGTKEELLELFTESHRRDIRIIMDIVVNHTSTEHKWFKKAFMEHDEKYRNFYIVKEGGNGDVPNNWKSFFGGSAWENIEGENSCYLHLFAKEQADLNWECEQLRKEVIMMMQEWIKLGVDGFRLDVINLISKDPDFPNDLNPYGIEGKQYYIRGPRIHEYLQELNREVFSPYEALTVGETMSASIEDAMLYTDPSRKELDMIFSMDHLEVDYKNGDRWTVQETDFVKLKHILSSWQLKLEEVNGWNSLFWSNHDQPRAVSRFGNKGDYRIVSAKMLATMMHMLKGTPYIYQGEEFGMLDPGYETIEEYQDIESLHVYRERTESGIPQDIVMKGIRRQSRDNARSPMQWNGEEYAGFTKGTPWMIMGKRYQEINAETDRKDPNGIFHHYQKLIELRKEEDLVSEGSYWPLDDDHPYVWCYARVKDKEALLIIGNFYQSSVEYHLPDEFCECYDIEEVLLSNYENTMPVDGALVLREYECIIYKGKHKEG